MIYQDEAQKLYLRIIQLLSGGIPTGILVDAEFPHHPVLRDFALALEIGPVEDGFSILGGFLSGSRFDPRSLPAENTRGLVRVLLWLRATALSEADALPPIGSGNREIYPFNESQTLQAAQTMHLNTIISELVHAGVDPKIVELAALVSTG